MTYPGGKGGAGVAQRLISLMPEHQEYVEPFAGSATIARIKRPAPLNNVLADKSAYVAERLRVEASEILRIKTAGGPPFIAQIRWSDFRQTLALGACHCAKTLVYCDPPYHPSTRSKQKIYQHEMTDADHRELLAMLKALPCFVMLSGYRCDLYDRELTNWNRVDYRTMTRGGPRIESCWMNFLPRAPYHDSRFAGEGFRDRERIKRKASRWARRIMMMPTLERQAILDAVGSVK